tara:strand:- start:3840 stop:4454 length:615 start_codon:yes stop_codon:yes gene_type:complete
MNKKLKKHGYFIERNFFNKPTTDILCLYSLKSVRDQISVRGALDNPTEHKLSWNIRDDGHAAFDAVLPSMTEKMSRLCKVELIPSYYYQRIYLKGADMDGHIDRDACQYSCSVNLGQSEQYPIYILDKHTNKYTEALLEPGDAMIYMGCEQRHFRKIFRGDWYSQLFLHWVDETRPECFWDGAATSEELLKGYTDQWKSILYNQ